MLLQTSQNSTFLKIKNSHFALVPTQNSEEPSLRMVQKYRMDFELKGKVAWHFINVAEKLIAVGAGDADKGMAILNDHGGAFVDADGYFFSYFLCSAVIDMGFSIDTHESGILL